MLQFSDAVRAKLDAKISELVGQMDQGITLQARRGPDDRLEIPVSTTCMFAITFGLLELREMGVKVSIATPDGRVMTDDELANAILHADKHQ